MDGIHGAVTNDFSVYVDDDSDLYGDREAPLKSDITREGCNVCIQVEPDEAIPVRQPLHHRTISTQVAEPPRHEIADPKTVEAIHYYLNEIFNKRVPVISPDLSAIEKLGFRKEVKEFNNLLSGLNIWAMTNQKWVLELANWIKDDSCLEVMSGNGLLAKALTEKGVDVIATDDKSWSDPDSDKISFCEVEPLDAISAVKKHNDRKILIMSWPPPNLSVSHDVLKMWDSEKPVIFIGDRKGGMTACDEFYNHFKVISEQPVKNYLPAHDAQDTVLIGYYIP